MSFHHRVSVHRDDPDGQYSRNDLRIEAPRKLLGRIRRQLGRRRLDASGLRPIEVRDWQTGLHVRYGVDDDVGVGAIHALAAGFPEATFTLWYDWAFEDFSGVARWAAGSMVGDENDGPTNDEDQDELLREQILLTSPVHGRYPVAIPPRRWAAVCGLARRYGWAPSSEVADLLDAPPGPIGAAALGIAHPCAHVQVDLLTLPADAAARLAAALGAAADAYGLPVALQERLGIRTRAPATVGGGPLAADPLDRATPRAVLEVRRLANAGGELRVARLVRLDRRAG